jgi:putative ABC transport system permease protein
MRLLPFEYASRNLARSWARSAFGVCGSALVVALVVVAAAFVRGMDRGFTAGAQGRNVIVLGAGSEESTERSEIGGAVAALLEASIPGVRRVGGVAFISPEVHVGLPLGVSEQGADRPIVLVRGVTAAAFMVHDARLLDGRLPRPAAQEVMVGRLAGAALGHADALGVGQQLWLDGKPWTITGIFAAAANVMESEVWAPLPDLKTATKRESDSCVVLTLADAEFEDIDVFCRQRLDLELSAMRETEYYARLASFFGPIRALVWASAALIGLGGLLGGLNTLYAAFTARIREFGMLQCLGFRRGAVLVSLVQESLLLSCIGALLATGLVMALLDGVSVQFSTGAFRLDVDSAAVTFGLAAGCALGVAGALPPAWRCLRMPLPESLKSL